MEEFQKAVANHDYPSFLRFWEEYCAQEEVPPKELKQILELAKKAPFVDNFGRHIERAIPLWKKLEPDATSDDILRLLIDIQTANSPELGELAYEHLRVRHGSEPHFSEKIRLVGLRAKEEFQGAISNYELLSHLDKGKYVFHTGGWGVGEVLDVSVLREQLSLEFDYVPGHKELSFANAFKMLVPIPDDHFLALRFGKPDLLERQARENPVEVLRMLLRDLGPKTATEIKDELCELVIPEKEWVRWWQAARMKARKDTMIETPEDIRDPFRLRGEEVTHEERLQGVLLTKPDANTLIHMMHSFMKDFPETLKNETFRATLQSKLKEVLSCEEITDSQELQIHFFLQDLSGEKEYAPIAGLLKHLKSIEDLIQGIDLTAFKKRALVEIRRVRADWQEIFLNILFVVGLNPLRDYILRELVAFEEAREPLSARLEELINYPHQHPDVFLWYFQKAVEEEGIPFANRTGMQRLFESLFILLNHVEQTPSHKEYIKKIHSLLSAGRYAVVRKIMQDASLEGVKEYLLLATKCHSLSDHDLKILHSLAEVVYPSLGKLRKKHGEAATEVEEILTTAEGYQKLQERIQTIATVETVDNAKEIEVARAHGDLRENAEFKASLERRDRLQSELKFLSDQLNHMRIVSKEEISSHTVGFGNVVECKNSNGHAICYTLLGPWDADTDKQILSFQSKLAQTMKGHAVGEQFSFQGERYTITSIRPYLTN